MPAAARRSESEVPEPIRCVVFARPSADEKHKKDMLRYFVLVIALLAVVFLMAIALYYTQGNSVSIEHVSLLLTQPPVSA